MNDSFDYEALLNETSEMNDLEKDLKELEDLGNVDFVEDDFDASVNDVKDDLEASFYPIDLKQSIRELEKQSFKKLEMPDDPCIDNLKKEILRERKYRKYLEQENRRIRLLINSEN